MFAETDFGLLADPTLDVTDKMSVGLLLALAVGAGAALLALAWVMRGAF